MRPDRAPPGARGDWRARHRPRRAVRTPLLTLRLLSAALLAATILSCSRAAPCTVGGSVTECGQATGILLSVEGESAVSVQSFSLRKADGTVLEFEVGRLELDTGGLPAPHLREHLRDGSPITVDYKLDGGRHVALRYVDEASD